jgi:CubicO group peptidase (beta-lactamase class C family)
MERDIVARAASTSPRRVRWPLAVLLLLTLILGGTQRASLATSYWMARTVAGRMRHWLSGIDRPNVSWDVATPEHEGLSPAVLDGLRSALAAESTAAFLVIRGNHVAYEWYAPSFGPNKRWWTAAMAKATAANPVLLKAVTDGLIGLDDPVSRYIPSWRNDSLRLRIRIRDLAEHQSGIETEDFDAKAGWKQRYFAHLDQRFPLAIDTAKILWPPGIRYSYSGIGYYVLAYALTASLQGAPQPDARSFLRERIMKPLGIPDSAWSLSYGESYHLGGMTLYALGSGAEYTARAAARMGQLFLDYGRWKGRRILDSALVAQSRLPATAMLPPDSAEYVWPPSAAAGGWWVNSRGTWPALPHDALVGMGTGHEVILVVPSLDLVMVRLGQALAAEPQFQAAMEARIFAPLMRAVVGPSSRMRRPATRSSTEIHG